MDVAALLLQGSIQVYSRKVEYLYSLVLRALEFLSQKGLVYISLLNNLFWEFIVNFFKIIIFYTLWVLLFFPKLIKICTLCLYATKYVFVRVFIFHNEIISVEVPFTIT